MDGIEKELAGRAEVARLSIMSELGRGVAARYGVRSVPTFLIFSSEGTVIGRQIGFPNRQEIEALVAEDLSQDQG